MSVIYCHGCDKHVDTDFHPSSIVNGEEMCEDCADQIGDRPMPVCTNCRFLQDDENPKSPYCQKHDKTLVSDLKHAPWDLHEDGCDRFKSKEE